MTLYIIKKNINCDDSGTCFVDILHKLEMNLNLILHGNKGEDPNQQGYVNLIHQGNIHFIILCLYDSKGHEYLDSKYKQKLIQTGNIDNPMIITVNKHLNKTTKTISLKELDIICTIKI